MYSVHSGSEAPLHVRQRLIVGDRIQCQCGAVGMVVKRRFWVFSWFAIDWYYEPVMANALAEKIRETFTEGS